ncbi:hypothetical protein O3P69_012087 [Scylla paramamosain]|uniref:Prohormone-1 n=1 Tax=Scylla paramamosain TaxID=85552 RepID=A0A0S2YRB6_SCYPA|nr:uncharacterized protein LOC123516558 [Portunus trituberculatus]ALQ28598.1 prohormone-1 [Scylla paramamosain]
MSPRLSTVLILAVVVLAALGTTSAKPLGEQDPSAGGPPAFTAREAQVYEPYGNNLEEDGSLDAALINYLFAKQLVQRLRSPSEVSRESQRKRSYWKQCAFNAVSCFGKRK